MLEDNQKINAIAWEAKKRNLSYGIFSSTQTEENKKNICEYMYRYWDCFTGSPFLLPFSWSE